MDTGIGTEKESNRAEQSLRTEFSRDLQMRFYGLLFHTVGSM